MLIYLLLGGVWQLMRRTRSFELGSFYLEIKRTLRNVRAARRNKHLAMEANNQQQHAIREYFKPVVNDNYIGIARQTINANNFELKPALINMVQQNEFGGSPLDDPNVHLAMFLKICDTVKMNNVSADTT